jgi:hypothetical protein
MSSRATTPAESSNSRSGTSLAPSANTVTSVFGRMMNAAPPQTGFSARDRCFRLTPIYNNNYDPNRAPPTDQHIGYSPYVYGEPLYDDRAVVVARLPARWTIAPPTKRPRTSWVWKLGYALLNNTKASSPTLMWACKLCHHDEAFSRRQDWTFNANTLNNAEKHLRKAHYLDEGGDMWRIRGDQAQASGPVDGGYEKVIPFRQQEFKNALMEWIICDNIKHKKAASPRLLRAFKIANIQAVNSIPTSSTTVATWIHEMFDYFEPEVIEEIQGAKSKIHISFDGWGSKHEKISVIGVVVHFINSKYEAVTRLIGLPELPDHSKTGVCKL